MKKVRRWLSDAVFVFLGMAVVSIVFIFPAVLFRLITLGMMTRYVLAASIVAVILVRIIIPCWLWAFAKIFSNST